MSLISTRRGLPWCGTLLKTCCACVMRASTVLRLLLLARSTSSVPGAVGIVMYFTYIPVPMLRRAHLTLARDDFKGPRAF
jgi:hypothetical protein